jgi:hypothetical protein
MSCQEQVSRLASYRALYPKMTGEPGRIVQATIEATA